MVGDGGSPASGATVVGRSRPVRGLSVHIVEEPSLPLPALPDPRASLSRARGGIALGRSPFEPGVVGRGVALGLGLAALTALLGWPLVQATPIGVEVEVFSALDVRSVTSLVGLATVLSHVGHLVPVAWVAVMVAVFARWRWGSWDLGLLLLVVLGGASAVTGVVKILTSRARPDQALVETLSSAYPSGHAVRAAAVYGLIAWLALLVARGWASRVLIVVAAVALIALNALARVALAAHWPTDVLIGLVVGTVWLTVSLRLLRPRTLVAARKERAERTGGVGRG